MHRSFEEFRAVGGKLARSAKAAGRQQRKRYSDAPVCRIESLDGPAGANA